MSNSAIARRHILAIVLIIIAAAIGLYVSTANLQASQPPLHPFTITDDLGRNVTINKQPQKIVSLIPSSTQVVFAVGAGSRIVGVTRYDDFPPELVDRIRSGSVIVVGGGLDPDIEKIVVLNPDLVLINGPSYMGSSSVKKLQELRFAVVGLNPNSIEGIIKNIELVGRITGNTEKADQSAKAIRDKVDHIVSKTKNSPKIRVYIENWHDPLFTVGPGSLQNEMIEKAGGTNIFSDLRGSIQIRAEEIIARNPEIIISFNNQISLQEIRQRPAWDRITAVRENKIFQMHPQEGSPNPRIADSLEKMARILHPGLFYDRPSLSPAQVALPLMS